MVFLQVVRFVWLVWEIAVEIVDILAVLVPVAETADRLAVPEPVVEIVDKQAVPIAVDIADRRAVSALVVETEDRQFASASAVETVGSLAVLEIVAWAFVAWGLAVRTVDRAVDTGDKQVVASAFVVETADTLVAAQLAWVAAAE